jgi:hypothetical protein
MANLSKKLNKILKLFGNTRNIMRITKMSWKIGGDPYS